jgi:hypothetical protein
MGRICVLLLSSVRLRFSISKFLTLDSSSILNADYYARDPIVWLIACNLSGRVLGLDGPDRVKFVTSTQVVDDHRKRNLTVFMRLQTALRCLDEIVDGGIVQLQTLSQFNLRSYYGNLVNPLLTSPIFRILD